MFQQTDRPTNRKKDRPTCKLERKKTVNSHRQTDTLIDRPVCYSKRHPWLPSKLAGHYRTSRAAVNRTTGRSLHRLVKVEWELQTAACADVQHLPLKTPVDVPTAILRKFQRWGGANMCFPKRTDTTLNLTEQR